jgi:hypothetical protein
MQKPGAVVGAKQQPQFASPSNKSELVFSDKCQPYPVKSVEGTVARCSALTDEHTNIATNAHGAPTCIEALARSGADDREPGS